MISVDSSTQVLGRTQTIGCVAVEITQKCNLNCTLCYLSEHSQSVRDIPISEVYRRLDSVVEHYGAGTHVQITGGDPTLRKHTELVEIVRYASGLKLYPALFTNGIGATPALLQKLARAGLKDVAFHVDTTQRREGYASELELNAVRLEYIERTRGLGLMVIFNTTVHADNFSELPELVRFFRDNADVIGMVSFNLQAETGRGDWGSRDDVIDQTSVRAKIEAGAGKVLPWDVVQIGHRECHSYMPTFVVNGHIHPVISDKKLFGDFLRDFQSVTADRHSTGFTLGGSYLWSLLQQPAWWLRALGYAWSLAKPTACGLLRTRRSPHKLSFFIQNFMDANNLQQQRLHACSFMVMTAEGPVPMCEHNASRDDYILKPLDITREDGSMLHYEPLVWQNTQPSRVRQL
jgi:molybdenum cofactor biosynthesis enzyme MoaA